MPTRLAGAMLMFAAFVVGAMPGQVKLEKPSAAFTVTVPVSLDDALSIHAALTERPMVMIVGAQTVEQAIGKLVEYEIANLVTAGRDLEARSLGATIRGLSKADRDAILAEIEKRKKPPVSAGAPRKNPR